MTLWFVLALMTALAVFAVLWPLSRRGGKSGGSEVVVYRDQLDEIVRDRAAGIIGAAEAEAAKVEVSRRLIAAADAAQAVRGSGQSEDRAAARWRRRATAVVALLLLPLGAVAIYLALGSPQLPGEPLGPRLAAIHNNHSFEGMVAQVERHLATDPNDVRGYVVLAPVYLRLGRYDDAVNAQRKILALSGETAARQADLGEALTLRANGVVTAEAMASFQRALALDAKEIKARFYVGVASVQDGNRDKATGIWRALLADAPPGAPWAANVREALAQIGVASAPEAAAAAAAGPNAHEIEAASAMSKQDRDSMIRGMVAQLAGKLKQDGGDLEGWRRLLRAYTVLGERDKAQAAAADARRALAGDPDKLHGIDDTIHDMGLER
jgi:cytochrome c-type biogenesis protein CcmH